MSSTVQRTEPTFTPAKPRSPTPDAPAGRSEGPGLWPWAAASVCAIALAVPSLMAVPQRLAAERAAAVSSVQPAPRATAPAKASAATATDADVLVTGAIARPAVLQPPPALRLFGVRLAGGESADMLWTHWSELKARFPGVFDGVATAVRPAPGSTSPQRFELMAGRFRNAAEAASLCGRLRAHDIACAVKDLEEVPAPPPV